MKLVKSNPIDLNMPVIMRNQATEVSSGVEVKLLR